MPTGFDKRLNLPTGISFVGNLYDEATILSIANTFQIASPWDKAHPPLFK